MSNVITVKGKLATALMDVICDGVTIKKGEIMIAVRLDYCKDWPGDGYRTYIETDLGYTSHENYYKAFSTGC